MILPFLRILINPPSDQGTLSFFHTVLFGLGLVFDTTGTLMMAQIAQSNLKTVTEPNWHAITGVLTIALMVFHLIWAIWPIPYFSGVFVGMKKKKIWLFKI